LTKSKNWIAVSDGMVPHTSV